MIRLCRCWRYAGTAIVQVMTDLAVLFLDVDGTLIPFSGGPAMNALRLRPVKPGCQRRRPTRCSPGLTRRTAHGCWTLGCNLVWATSWMHEANEEISPRLGLPPLPVVPWSDNAEHVVAGRLHWKTRDLVTWAAGRAFVWVDDEITEADQEWVAAHHLGDALLHRVDANIGLTDSDFAAIRRWLG
jgi:hypothetical protein